MRIVIATGGTLGLAEWIIDGTHILPAILLLLAMHVIIYDPDNVYLEILDILLLLHKLIHPAIPQSRPVVITVFAHVVRPYVRLHFSNLEKQNNRK